MRTPTPMLNLASPKRSYRHTIQRCLSSTTSKPKTRPKTALFFPGQGVQRIGMTTEWLSAFPRTVKPLLDELDDTLRLSTPLSRIIAEGPNSLLTATENSQPAIMATSILILRVLEQDFGFKTQETVDVTLGHSLGEFAALVAAGYLRPKDAIRMLRRRGEVMAYCSKRTNKDVGMVALVCEPDQRDPMIAAVRKFLTDNKALNVQVANINSSNQFVLSGVMDDITRALEHVRHFDSHDPRAVRLKADSPFHSPLMEPAADEMRKILAKDDALIFPGTMPCVSNITARYFESKEEMRDLLARSCVESVLWHQSIQWLHHEEKVKRWIGIGPGKVGRNLVGKEVGMKGAVKGGGVLAITDPKEVDTFLRALEETEMVGEEDEEV